MLKLWRKLKYWQKGAIIGFIIPPLLLPPLILGNRFCGYDEIGCFAGIPFFTTFAYMYMRAIPVLFITEVLLRFFSFPLEEFYGVLHEIFFHIFIKSWITTKFFVVDIAIMSIFYAGIGALLGAIVDILRRK